MSRIPRCRPEILSGISKSLARMCINNHHTVTTTSLNDNWHAVLTGVAKSNNLQTEWDRLQQLAKGGEAIRQRWGVDHLAGIDEAGRGCWAGPVVAAVAKIPIQTLIEGVKDSKKLSEKARINIMKVVLSHPDIETAVDIRTADEIAETNILDQTRNAMFTASELLSATTEGTIGFLIDGKFIIPPPKTKISLTEVEGTLNGSPAVEVLSGDDRHQVVALASIVAKTVRDGYILRMSDIYPEYDFEKNRGYGTKGHRENLLKHGAVTGIHRQSFRPMSELPWVPARESLD
eukprot:TRINITY_DN4952_c0_g1_i1.p1 TRINITY_DN4952_c0_g1~~TRINITY_DN4952_c0_g1_i1.p1  ORF type:complete len:290 (+),score=56.79 TRINITY_DN4952_c0_g1_i1:671-1540(+)